MRQKVVRKGLTALVVAAATIALVVGAFTTPTSHEVHTPGATALKVGIAGPITPRGPEGGLVSLTPTQSLADVRCQMWHGDPRNQHRSEPCPIDSTLAQDYWPQLVQTAQTLYVGWRICGNFWYAASGVQTEYSSFNVEYMGSSRTLGIHCYSAKAWLQGPGGPHYAAAVPTTALLLVPTDGISPGHVRVVADDRIEHLIGDEITATLTGVATIDQYAPTGPLAVP